jgi:DNA-binding GntR family transcriptional regulator
MCVQTQLHAIDAAEANPGLRRGMRRSVHRDILRALRARDTDASVAAIVAHYAYARERLLTGHPVQPATAVPQSIAPRLAEA